MAHGDYNCCACCDSKMAYSADATTKEELCAPCAVNLSFATGRKITSGAEMVAWIEESPDALATLAEVGYDRCHYSNPVDDAVAKARAGTPGGDE